jgi:hypothetical protein
MPRRNATGIRFLMTATVNTYKDAVIIVVVVVVAVVVTSVNNLLS